MSVRPHRFPVRRIEHMGITIASMLLVWALAMLVGIWISYESIFAKWDLLLPCSLILLLSILSPVLLRTDMNWNLLEPLWLVGFGFFMFFVIVPLLYIYAPDVTAEYALRVGYALPDPYLYLRPILWLSLISFVGFLTGYRISLGKKIGLSLPSIGRLDRSRLQLGILGLLVVGSISYYIYYTALGGWRFMLANMNTRARWLADEGLVGYGYFFWLMQPLILIPALLYVYYYSDSCRKHIPKFFLVSISGLIFIMFFLLGGRGRALQPITLLFLTHWTLRRQIGKLLILIVGIFVFLIVSVGLVVRGEGLGRDFVGNPGAALAMLHVPILQALLQGGFDRIETLALIFDFFPRTIDYQWGKSYIAPLMPVLTKLPFGLDYGDFPSAGVFLGQVLYSTETPPGGPSPSLFGETYMNFGPLAVPFSLLAMGVFTRALYTYYRKNVKGNPLAGLLYGFLLLDGVYSVIFHGGVSAGLFKVGAVLFAPLLVVVVFSTKSA